tara:strand:+ start:303 stop:506 length:204 start_codon:yes stop_codon:yes gene_type:complete
MNTLIHTINTLIHAIAIVLAVIIAVMMYSLTIFIALQGFAALVIITAPSALCMIAVVGDVIANDCLA